MPRGCCFFLLVVLTVSVVWAQPIDRIAVRGIVIDAENGEPMPGVNVFLNNTSFKDQTNLDGAFVFGASPGSYELVVYQQGYQTFLTGLKTDTLSKGFRIALQPLAYDIPAMTISSERDPEWYDNLRLFKQAFLGTTVNASKCIIDNEEQLIMDLDRSRSTLKVWAREPIRILNPRLGYRMTFVLEDFGLDLRRNTVGYHGYANFSELEAGSKRLYQKRREKAYIGSIQHWLKSMFWGTSLDEGFKSYLISPVYNPEKPHADTLRQIQQAIAAYEAGSDIKVSLRQRALLSKVNLPDSVERVSTNLWPYWEALTFDQDGALLHGPIKLQVVFLEETPSSLYRQQTRNRSVSQVSDVHVKQTVRIYRDGHFSPPTALLFTGYMAWEHVGDMLPINFEITTAGEGKSPR